MSKHQRGNKEAKKPKQVKAPPVPDALGSVMPAPAQSNFIKPARR